MINSSDVTEHGSDSMVSLWLPSSVTMGVARMSFSFKWLYCFSAKMS